MISVDDRAGSAQYAPLLRSLGVEVDLTRMAFGDIAWQGIGPNSLPVSVGIEVKTLADVLACITSGRFAGHQLPGLLQSYDHVWLMIEGEYRPRRKDGALEFLKPGRNGASAYWSEPSGGKRSWFWRDLESWLLSMAVMGGIRIHHVRNAEEGALWIKGAYHWFQREEHKSHLVMYSGKELYSDKALLLKPSLARRIAAELPGVGAKKSAAVAARFRNLAEMSQATEKDWMQVDGIGKGLAKQIVKAIHNGHGNHKQEGAR